MSRILCFVDTVDKNVRTKADIQLYLFINFNIRGMVNLQHKK